MHFTMKDALSTNQRKWQEHLKAAETSGMRLSAYAAQHDINVRRLHEERHYAAKSGGGQSAATTFGICAGKAQVAVIGQSRTGGASRAHPWRQVGDAGATGQRRGAQLDV